MDKDDFDTTCKIVLWYIAALLAGCFLGTCIAYTLSDLIGF